MASTIEDLAFEFQRHRRLAENAIARLTDDGFFARPAGRLNSVALVIKHLAGNLQSRWTDFGSSDGESKVRDRDSEFVIGLDDSRTRLMESWDQGWAALFAALAAIDPDGLDRLVSIRGEPHRILQALLRSLTHVAYHTGQILYLARWFDPEGEWLTIAPGQSRQHRRLYFQFQ